MKNNRVIPVVLLSALLATLLATTALAAPVADGNSRPTCSAAPASYPLGIDGGLVGLSRGEFVVAEVVAAAPTSRPMGVDGGILSLLFASSQGNSFAASTGNACTGV